MKALGFKLILLLVLGGFVAPMMIPGPDGKPIMTLDDWIPSGLIAKIEGVLNSLGNLKDAPGDIVDSATDAVIGEGAQIYVWRDAEGVLHYSDQAVEGADAMLVPHDGLAIPADRFVRSGLAPEKPKPQSRRGGQAVLLEEHAFPGSGGSGNRRSNSKSAGDVSLEDINAMANGDFSNSAEVMQNLPALLEQLKSARAKSHADPQ